MAVMTWPLGVLTTSCRMNGGIIMFATYGIDVKEHNDPYLEITERALECVRVTLVPGAYLVDLLPFREDLFIWSDNSGTLM
jgi:hypothetical protein